MDFTCLVEETAPGWKPNDLALKWAETKVRLFAILADAVDREERGEKLENYFSADVLKLYKEVADLQPADDDFIGWLMFFFCE